MPSPGYVNEVNSCKVDEGDAGKWKGKQGSQALGHHSELLSGGLKGTASWGGAGGGQEPPRGHPLGAPPPGDTVEGHCADKAGSAVNGIGPAAAATQPAGDRGPHQGDRGSCVSTTNGAPPTPPFPEGGVPGRQDSALLLLAPRETHVVQSGAPGPAFGAEGPALGVHDRDFQMPAPDYPRPRGPAGDTADREAGDGVSGSPREEEPPAGIPPRVGGRGWNTPSPLKRSWDSLNTAEAAEALSVYFRDEDAAEAEPGADSRTGREDAVDEDAAVAEALAALEAATAGEDVDEAE